MKPDWDKLMEKYEGHASALVADVDCTDAGKDLCEANGVDGYPTIKYGDPSALEDYQGERSYEALEQFAEENLKPMCSPTNIDLCEGEKKTMIESFMTMPEADLLAEIEKKDAEMKDAEKVFDDAVQKLQEEYERLEKVKTETQAAIKSGGFTLLKAVKAARGIKTAVPDADHDPEFDEPAAPKEEM